MEMFELAETLLECARSELLNTENGVPPWSCVLFGEMTKDYCCEGQLTVSIDRMYPSIAFPEPVVDSNSCSAPLTAVQYTIGIYRCMPTPDGEEGPSCEELTELSRHMAEDAYAVWKGVMCCLLALKNPPENLDAVFTDMVAVGPEEQCIGAEMHVTVGLYDTCVCPPAG